MTNPFPPFLRLAEIEDNPHIDWLAPPILLANEPAVIGGRGGQMKTSVALAMLGGLATGGMLFGRFESTAAHTTAIVSGEDSEAVIKNRLMAICRGHGYRTQLAVENIHILALAGVDLADGAWVRHIISECLGRGVSVLWFDPLGDLSSLKENDPDERRQLVRILRRIASETETTVGTNHHFKKSSAGDAAEKTDDLLRGGNPLANAMRQTYAVELTPDGDVAVECLKFSRAAKPAPFLLRPHITESAHNKAVWESARFEYVTQTVAKLDRAETFLLEQLALGERLTTTDLKKAATGTQKGVKVSGADVSRALKVLEMRRVIGFKEGAKGAKLWGLTLPTESGQPGQPENRLARQPLHLPGNHASAAFACPPPLGGQGKLKFSGQPDEYELTERQALEEGA